MNTVSYTESFKDSIRNLTENYTYFWLNLPAGEIELSRRFSPRQQRENEKQLDRQLKLHSKTLGEVHGQPNARSVPIAFDTLKLLTGSSLLQNEDADADYFKKSEATTRQFVEEAKTFDPSLSQSDIHQALRNLWVFNNIQMIAGQQISLTPSSFAYSLLYPYTDNGLDSKERTSEEKRAYIQWLDQWFQGNKYGPMDDWTAKIAELLLMIEKEYPSAIFSEVYMSLYAIHSAQTRSLLLHNVHSEYSEELLSEITVEKGGTSVLVDGYLAAGALTPEQMDAFFEYGVVLQLLDDIRDVEEDTINLHSTPFTRAASAGNLDCVAERLVAMTKHSAEKLSALNRLHGRRIKEMVEQSCSFLIFETAASHPEYYSPYFLSWMEVWMPLRPAYLRSLKHKFKKDMTAPQSFAASHLF